MRKIIKIALWTIFALVVSVPIAYWLQPTDIVAIPAILTKVTISPKTQDFFAVFQLKTDCDCAQKKIFDFKYPAPNNWSSYNRDRLPFPALVKSLSIYFSDEFPPAGRPAKIYLLFNGWTGNQTTDEPAAQIL